MINDIFNFETILNKKIIICFIIITFNILIKKLKKKNSDLFKIKMIIYFIYLIIWNVKNKEFNIIIVKFIFFYNTNKLK